MTRGDLLYKWFWYAMALFPVWLAEAVIFTRFPIWGLRPMLLPLAAVAVAVLEGAVAGAGFGLGVGLLWSTVLGPSGAPMVFVLSLAGALVGAASQYGLKQSFPGCLLCSVGLLGAIDLLRILSRLMGNAAPFLPMLKLAAAEILVSLVFTIPIYLLFQKVYSRVGGTKLM